LIFGQDSSLQHEYQFSRVTIIYDNTKLNYLSLVCFLHRNNYAWMIPRYQPAKKRTSSWWSRELGPAAWLLQMHQYPHGGTFAMGWSMALTKDFI
jgi:hypothetical protein